MGFWIDMKKADYLVVAGLVPDVTQIELGHNWNFVGYPSFIEMTLSDALKDVDWMKAEGYDDTPPFNLKQLTGGDIVRAGEGYWVWVDLPQIWEVFNKLLASPYIISTDPGDGEKDIPLNASIFVKFSKPMDATSVSLSMVPAIPFSTDWFDNDTLIVFSHTSPFVECVGYTVSVSGLDKSGNSLVPGPVPNPWTFYTIVPCPYIVSSDPINYQTDVPRLADIVVVFSRPMNASSLIWNITPDPGGWSENWPSDDTLVLSHSNPYQQWTRYDFELTYIEDRWGTPLCDLPFVLTFIST